MVTLRLARHCAQMSKIKNHRLTHSGNNVSNQCDHLVMLCSKGLTSSLFKLYSSFYCIGKYCNAKSYPVLQKLEQTNSPVFQCLIVLSSSLLVIHQHLKYRHFNLESIIVQVVACTIHTVIIIIVLSFSARVMTSTVSKYLQV